MAVSSMRGSPNWTSTGTHAHGSVQILQYSRKPLYSLEIMSRYRSAPHDACGPAVHTQKKVTQWIFVQIFIYETSFITKCRCSIKVNKSSSWVGGYLGSIRHLCQTRSTFLGTPAIGLVLGNFSLKKWVVAMSVSATTMVHKDELPKRA